MSDIPEHVLSSHVIPRLGVDDIKAVYTSHSAGRRASRETLAKTKKHLIMMKGLAEAIEDQYGRPMSKYEDLIRKIYSRESRGDPRSMIRLIRDVHGDELKKRRYVVGAVALVMSESISREVDAIVNSGDPVKRIKYLDILNDVSRLDHVGLYVAYYDGLEAAIKDRKNERPINQDLVKKIYDRTKKMVDGKGYHPPPEPSYVSESRRARTPARR